MSLANTANGDVNAATRFYYCQKSKGITAKYEGKSVQFSGKCSERILLNLLPTFNSDG